MNQHDPTVYATGGNVSQRGSLAAPNITADYMASLVADRDRLRAENAKLRRVIADTADAFLIALDTNER